MGLIARPAKEGGFLTYVEKVLAGFEFILDSEADADFETIYNEFNGNITNANISGTAAIAYAKLLLTGSIITADLANGAVTRPKVATMAHEVGTATGGIVASTETVVASVTITTTGGPVLLLAPVGTSVTKTGSSETTVLWSWKRGATLIAAIGMEVSGVSGDSFEAPMLPPPWIDGDPAPAAGTYTYTLVVTPGTALVTTPGGFQGAIIAKELLG